MKMKCSVDGCTNFMDFKFPKNEGIRAKWLYAIKKPLLKPKTHDGVCLNHFERHCFYIGSIHLGTTSGKLHLRRNSVPSIFPWSQKPPIRTLNHNQSNNSSKSSELLKSNGNSCVIGSICDDSSSSGINSAQTSSQVSLLHQAVIKVENDKMETDCDQLTHEENSEHCKVNRDSIKNDKFSRYRQANRDFVKNELINYQNDKYVQTNAQPRYDIYSLENDPEAVLYFTGLENFSKYQTVYNALKVNFKSLKYENNGYVKEISLENQLFLTLWKLRRDCPDFELSRHFNISKLSVGNIFRAWIRFMAKTWSKINTWPSKELITYFMPDNFKKEFLSTHLIIDGSDIPIHYLKSPKFQQSLFSYYKNDANVNSVMGNAPGGLFIYCSPSHESSNSESQAVEKDNSMSKSNPNNITDVQSVTAQDVFAPHNITVLTPHPSKVKGFVHHEFIVNKGELTKYKINVDRIIRLLKTYKILSTTLNRNYVPLASEIVGVCSMLYNFKACIVKIK